MYWRFPANFTIPTIYDETMAYEIQIGDVLRSLREMKKIVESLAIELSNYTDEEIGKIKDWSLKAIYNPLSRLINDLDAKVDRYTEEENALIADVRDKLKEIEELKADKDFVSLEIRKAEERGYKVLHEEVLKLKHLIHDEIVKLDKELATAIENLTTYADRNLELSNKYSDGLLAVAKAYADLIRTDLLGLIADVEIRNNKYTTIAVSKEKFNRELDILRLQKLIDDLPSDKSGVVYNIPRGKKTSVQQAITDLYVGLRPFALTNNTLTERNVTYEDIQKIGLTWFEWDVYHGVILAHWDTKVFSPVSGKRLTLYECLCELTNVLRWNAKTMDWWDKHSVKPEEAELNGVSIYDWTFTRKILKSDISEKINLLLTLSQTLWINDSANPVSMVGIELPFNENFESITIQYTGLEGGVLEKRIDLGKGTRLYMLHGQKAGYDNQGMPEFLTHYENYFSYDNDRKFIQFMGCRAIKQTSQGQWSTEFVNDMFVPLKIINNTKHDSILTMKDGFIDLK